MAREASHSGPKLPVAGRLGLSAQLLLITVVFVFFAEALIFLFSVASERRGYLEARIMDADLVALLLGETRSNVVNQRFATRLLEIAEVRAIVYRDGQTRRLVLSAALPAALDVTYDLRDVTRLDNIQNTLGTIFQRRNRVMRLIGPSRHAPGTLVEVLMDEAPMIAHLRSYSVEVLRLSALISIFTAGLIFLILQWRLVGPMRRITRSIVAFRKNLEGPRSVVVPGLRGDEIGVAERELEMMQIDLRGSLRQNQSLADLETVVSKDE